METYITPLNHTKFKAKRIDDKIFGNIENCSVAYIEPGGGGPNPSHTHAHNHYFIVIEGQATIKINSEKVIVHKDESIIVQGSDLHSVWNETDKMVKMIGLTLDKGVC